MGIIMHDDIAYSGASGGAEIDDTTTSSSKVWSSQKTSTEIANNAYTLPTASANTLGGIKVGNGLSINDGVLSASGISGIKRINDSDRLSYVELNFPNASDILGGVGGREIMNNTFSRYQTSQVRFNYPSGTTYFTKDNLSAGKILICSMTIPTTISTVDGSNRSISLENLTFINPSIYYNFTSNDYFQVCCGLVVGRAWVQSGTSTDFSSQYIRIPANTTFQCWCYYLD